MIRKLVIFQILAISLWAVERQATLRMAGPLVHPPTGLNVWVFQTADIPADSVMLPGPVVSARVGDELQLEILNDTDQPQSLYFLGLAETNGYDGFLLPGETPTLQPGSSTQFYFTFQRTGVFPYFATTGGPLGLQLGLFGVIVVQDSVLISPAPRLWLAYEQDPRWHTAGWSTNQLNQYVPEFFGLNANVISPGDDTLGIEVIFQEESYRYWVVNCGFWLHHYQFQDLNVQVYQRNGYPVDPTYLIDELLLYPGERAEVVLQPNGPDPRVRLTYFAPLETDSVQGLIYLTVLPGAGPTGDVNLDGRVTVQDLVLMVRMVLGQGAFSNTQFQMADLNEDEQLNVQDIVLLVQRIIGP